MAKPKGRDVTGSFVLLSLLWLASATPAQETTSLSERSDYVGACRTTANATPLYENARLTKEISLVPANTQVTLTGVVGNGIAQIKQPGVGWLRSASLLNRCDDGVVSPLPPDIDTNPIYCRRIRNSQVDGAAYAYLNAGLVAFAQPGGEMHRYQGRPDGPGGGAVVRLTQSPAQTQAYGDRDWVRVKYRSQSGTQRIGWIALGPRGGLRSLANCLPGQE